MKPRIKKDLPQHGRTKINTRSVPKHLAWIRTLPCATASSNCRGGVQSAHVRNDLPPDAQKGGMGIKPGDRWSVPLCEFHHIFTQHVQGELAFWNRRGIDPVSLAERLWRVSGDTEAGLRAIERAKAVGRVRP